MQRDNGWKKDEDFDPFGQASTWSVPQQDDASSNLQRDYLLLRLFAAVSSPRFMDQAQSAICYPFL